MRTRFLNKNSDPTLFLTYASAEIQFCADASQEYIKAPASFQKGRVKFDRGELLAVKPDCCSSLLFRLVCFFYGYWNKFDICGAGVRYIQMVQKPSL